MTSRIGPWILFVAWRMIRRPTSIRSTCWPHLCVFLGTIAGSYGLLACYPESFWSLGIAVAASILAGAALCIRIFTATVAASIVGVALSCGALITALMITTSFETALIRHMTRLHGHILLTKYGLDFRYDPTTHAHWRNDPRIQAVSPFAYSIAAIHVVADSSALSEQPSTAIVMAKALDPQAVQAWNGLAAIFQSQTFNALRPGDVHHLPGIALGSSIAERLGTEVGDKVRLVIPEQLDGNPLAPPKPPRHASFEVLDRIQTGLEDIDDSLVMIHLSAGQALFFGQARLTGVEFQLVDPEQAEPIAAELEASLGANYRATPWQQQNIGTLAGIRQIKVAIIVLLTVFEVVAACTLIASLLFLIRKKQQKIAGLMVLGASRVEIFGLFETVGLLIGWLGICGGSLLAGLSYLFFQQGKWLLSMDVIPLVAMPIDVRWQDLGLSLGSVLGLCLLASGPIAIVASRLPLLTSLRLVR